MEDDASIFLDGKTLANLRVVDLKLELEKRGLSKSGSKKDLVKRLKQQLEFEKLCGERKSTGDCDLKLELDADTEQNEFVQQYLAQQQKIYAQQKEAKRRVELEEIQKSGDEKESCDSTKEGDDDKTEDESETEPKNQKADKVTNDSTIALPPSKHTKNEKDVFEDAAQPSSVNETEHSTRTKYQNAENIKKHCKIFIEDEDSAETPKPNAEVRDIEKDREKELSTAISSLLSVEKSEKEAVDEEDLSIEADTNAVDGGITRTTHDDDREKDLATAVLSSLLVDQDVETEAKGDHNVDSKTKVDLNIEMEAKVVQIVETGDKVSNSVEMEAKVDQKVETKAKVDQDIEMEGKEGHNVETKSKVDHKVETDVKVDHKVETEVKVDHKVETEAKVDHNVEAETKLDHKIETEGRVDQGVESKVVAADTCSDVDPPLHMESVNTETSSAVGKAHEKSIADVVPDSVEVNVERTIDVTDGSQSSVNEEASLEVVQKSPVEPGKITQAVQEEIISNMDVSSVPYSLSEIQLPESPVNIVKPQTRSQPGIESSKNTQSDEESNNVNSKSKKIKMSESGDLNGKDTKPSHKEKSSEEETTFQKEPESEKSHRASKVESAKRSKIEKSESDTSSDDEKSRLESKKGKGHRKKRGSSDDDRSPVKSSSKSDRRKDRRNRSPSSDEDGHSRDRSRSPKSSKSDRRNRSHEKEHHSRKKSKRGSPKKSSREGRKKRDRKHRSKSSEEESTRDRSPKKSSKVGRREQSASSEEDRPSRTRSRESPKKGSKVSQKDQSVSSDDEQASKAQVRESPEKDTKESRRERSVTPEEKQQLDSETPDSSAVASSKELRQSPEKERHSRSHSEEESSKKESRTSHTEKSLKNETRGSEDEQDSSPLESSRKKSSDRSEKAVTKDPKRKHSVSSDEESSEKDSPIKKTKTIPSDDVSKPEDAQEEMDCSSPSRSSRRNRSPKPRQSRGRTSSSRSKSPQKATSSSRSRSPSEKVSRDNITVVPSRSSKRPPSPKEARRPSLSDSSSSPEKEDSKSSPERSSKVIPKDVVSDGELSSSGESSPKVETVSKWGPRKDSSGVSRQGTMTVIRKEAPKQRLKIKRDNVIVVKKDVEPESVPVVAMKEKDSESAPVDKHEKETESAPIVAQKEKEPESVPDESHSATEASVSETPESTDSQKLEPGECSEVPASTTYVSRKITLANRKRIEKPSEEPSNKRSKWGSFAASRKAKQTVSISTDSLKNWFPDFKLLKEPAAELIPEDPPSPVKETFDTEMTPVEKDVEEPKPISVTRRLEPPPLEDEPKKHAAEDARLDANVEPTKILFVRNLVRPFTLLQLKELLQETGKTVDEGFWIDKIKSKCFVTYETEEEAIKTRSVLNGARWPMSNPKILAVDFATEEDLAFRLGGVEQPQPLPPSSPQRPKEEEEGVHRERGGRERVPMREWDKDKMTQDSPEKGDRRREEERIKGADKDKKEAKRRPNEDTPAKLLDDLFQKTKATPCIYWLPLNEQQVKERLEKLRQVDLERERRNQEREQENKRPRSKQRGRETEARRSSSRSRSPVPRRR